MLYEVITLYRVVVQGIFRNIGLAHPGGINFLDTLILFMLWVDRKEHIFAGRGNLAEGRDHGGTVAVADISYNFV